MNIQSIRWKVAKWAILLLVMAIGGAFALTDLSQIALPLSIIGLLLVRIFLIKF